MSIKIYNAYRIPVKTISEVESNLSILRSVLNYACIESYIQLVSEVYALVVENSVVSRESTELPELIKQAIMDIVFIDDDHPCVEKIIPRFLARGGNEASESITECNKEVIQNIVWVLHSFLRTAKEYNDGVGYKVREYLPSLFVAIHDDNIIIKQADDNKIVSHELEQMTNTECFEFYDSCDAPKSVTEDDWNERKEVWEKVSSSEYSSWTMGNMMVLSVPDVNEIRGLHPRPDSLVMKQCIDFISADKTRSINGMKRNYINNKIFTNHYHIAGVSQISKIMRMSSTYMQEFSELYADDWEKVRKVIEESFVFRE